MYICVVRFYLAMQGQPVGRITLDAYKRGGSGFYGVYGVSG